MTTRTLAPKYSEAWFRSSNFDPMFILGIAVIAIASGLIVAQHPELFGPFLFLDLWLLGYHYVRDSFIWKLRKPQLKKTVGLT